MLLGKIMDSLLLIGGGLVLLIFPYELWDISTSNPDIDIQPSGCTIKYFRILGLSLIVVGILALLGL